MSLGSIFGKFDRRCPVCRAEWNEKAIREAGGGRVCPNPECGTVIEPLNTDYDGYVRINWQDLRVLAIYARRWSMLFDMTRKPNQDAVKALFTIIEGLKKYQPKGAPPLVPNEDRIEVVNGIVQQQENTRPGAGGDVVLDEGATWEKDEQGNIKSPFHFRKK